MGESLNNIAKNLKDIAKDLKNNNKKVQLIYAFNGTGKTRLSKEFKTLITSKNNNESDNLKKILYYNAFTEDLFYWDNNFEPILKIHPNSFTKWIFEDHGLDGSVIDTFQRYTYKYLTPKFTNNFSEVTFSYKAGNDEISDNIKISKGEESCFIWSIFYSVFEQVIEILNIPDKNERETDVFDNLEYIFIDDPVSSLDDNHLIQLAVDLGELIKSSESELKFIITTHNPLFYNVFLIS